MRLDLRNFVLVLCTPWVAAGCGGGGEAAEHSRAEPRDKSDRAGEVLRVAVTTSTRDSGLLDVLIPPFERSEDTRVDVLAVGTGAALQQGRDGNVDALIVHSRAEEDAFLAAGHGTRREDLMSNSFLILGPPGDPAGIAGSSAPAALRRIAEQGERFVSRGDRSGTHLRELRLWESSGFLPQWAGYVESGQGQGATLTMCSQMQAYMLVDHATYLARSQDLKLVPCLGPSAELLNPYGALAVNPKKHASIRGELAERFLDYLTSPRAQRIIAEFEIAGERPFRPARALE